MSYEKGSDIRGGINRAYAETIQIIGWTGLGIIAPMLILMFFIKEVKLSEAKDIYSGAISEEEMEIREEKESLKKNTSRGQ